MNRLKCRIGVGLLRVAQGAAWIGVKCCQLQEIVAPIPAKAKEELPFFDERDAAPDKYTLDLVAWRGDDGDNRVSFAVTPEQQEAIVALAGPRTDERLPVSMLLEGLTT